MADIDRDYMEEFIASSQELTLDERNLLLMLMREHWHSTKGVQRRPPRFKVVGAE